MSIPHTPNPAPAAAALAGKRPAGLTRAATASCAAPAVHLGHAADSAEAPA